MRYKTNCAISFRGDRVEKGTEIETTQDDAARFGGDLSPVEPVIEEAPPEEVKPLEAMNHAELKGKAKELGLSGAGSKADLQERIALHLSNAEGGGADGEEDAAEGGGADGEED